MKIADGIFQRCPSCDGPMSIYSTNTCRECYLSQAEERRQERLRFLPVREAFQALRELKKVLKNAQR